MIPVVNGTCNHRVCCIDVGVLDLVVIGTHQTLWLALQILATTGGVTLNVLLAWAVKKTKQMQRSAFMLLCMLSFVNNVFFAAAGMANYVVATHATAVDCYVHVTNKFLLKVTQNMFLSFLLAMAYCRYIYAKHTLSARKKITKKRVTWACLVLFVTAILNSSPTVLARIYLQFRLQTEAEATFALSLLLLSVAILAVYGAAITSMKPREPSQVRNHSSMGRQKMIKVAVCIGASLVTLQVPFEIAELIWAHKTSDQIAPLETNFILLGKLLYQLTPLASGIIVSYNNKEMKNCIRHLVEPARKKVAPQTAESQRTAWKNTNRKNESIRENDTPEQRCTSCK